MKGAKKVEKKEKKKIVRAVAKMFNKGHYNKYLMGINPYLQSLLDPFNNGGAKIPDLVVAKSSTFTIVCRRIITVNAQGVAAVCYGIAFAESFVCQGGLLPINDIQNWGPDPPVERTETACDKKKFLKQTKEPAPGAIPHPYVVGQRNSAVATSLDLFTFTGAVDELIQFDQWNETNGAVQNLFKSARLVSAGLACEYYGTPLDAKGKYTYASTTRNSPLRQKGPVSGITVDDIAKLPDAKITPLNKLKGVAVTYRPQDSLSLLYTDDLDAEIKHQVDDVPTQELLMRTLDSTLGGEFYIAVDGATPGTSLQTTFIGHYEGIPKYNTLMLLDSSQSPSDPIALSHAMNVAPQVPATIPSAPVSDFVNQPTSHGSDLQFHSSENATPQKPMMDSILENVDGFSSAMEKGMQAVDKLSPLAESALAFLA